MRHSTAVRNLFVLASLAVGSATAYAATYHHPWFDTRHGGSVCYYREYSDAFRKKNPSLKLAAISIERRNALDDARPNSKKVFGLKFGATTKSENYTALADCKPQGGTIVCGLESDGGQITLVRSGRGIVIKTRRVQLEGVFKDLDISSKRGGPTRSFTLKGSGKQTCASVFD